MSPTFPLADKVVLITGAGRGLGASTARVLAERGARVVVTDIDCEAASHVASLLPAGRGSAIEADVTEPDSIARAVHRVTEQFGQLDVTIANAGILGRGATFRTSTPRQIKSVLDVNIDGVINTVKAAVEPVIASRGQFVLISSVFAFINGAGAIPYAMSKAAVEQLARGLAVELAPHGVSTMTAYFSLIDTDLIREGIDEDPAVMELLAVNPDFLLKRIKPEVAAAAIANGLESRRSSLVVPSRWRPIAAMRGVAGPVLDARLAADPAVHRALARLENRAVEDQLDAGESTSERH